MEVRHMQGVSAHLELLKSKDKQRRHPAYCIFHHEAEKTEYVQLRILRITTCIANLLQNVNSTK